MSINYGEYLSLREHLIRTQTGSKRDQMLAELARMWPHHEWERRTYGR